MPTATDTKPATLPFSTLNDEDLAQTLKQHDIALTVEEAKKVTMLLGRDPTLVEAIVWGIQGSEHCSYKSSKRFLQNFLTKGTHIILGPSEDSGIVAITDEPKGQRWGLAITHESHNHPSQIVPFEGAATGVGGTVRDVVCMGARVVGCMDMLRLGDLHTEESKTIAKEVVRGIGGYGNPLGVPNLGGDTVFDASYNTNCLVNAIALGIVREDEIIHSYVPREAGEVGYDIILIGKPTDKSGFGGASFASASLEEDDRDENTGAVQEPNPFLERHILASTYALFDWLAAEKKLDKVSFKDLGAGGVVCATVEQVSEQGLGADVDLDKVHVAMADLPAEVIACAETQERLCWYCHPSLTEHILKHYNETWDLPSIAENAGASLIGKVRNDGLYRVTHQGQVVIEAQALDITCGLTYERPTAPVEYNGIEPEIICKDNQLLVSSCSLLVEKEKPVTSNQQPATFTITEIFKSILTHPNAASKEAVYNHYDKNVIGNTVVEPGEADASVIAPLQDMASYVHEGEHPNWELDEKQQWTGVALAADGNGRYGRISPYWQGVNAAVEAMRNVAAVGASPRALTDCLNYGNPETPEQLWELEQGIAGIAEAGKGVVLEGEPVPVISGNVSLYNCTPDGTSIDPTAVVSCMGVISDARQAVTMQVRKPGLHLYLIGERKDECGGSLYYDVVEQMAKADRDTLLGANVPQPDFAEVASQITFVTAAISQGLVHASHDISEGGLVLALFEMLLPQRKLGGDVGLSVDIGSLKSDLPSDKVLFCETGGFVLAVTKDQAQALDLLAKQQGIAIAEIGKTTSEQQFTVTNRGTKLIDASIDELIDLWKRGLVDRW